MRKACLGLGALLLGACTPISVKFPGYDTASDTGESGEAELADLDEDGFSVAEGDCDDINAEINPRAEEICNEVDDDCDGDTDEGVIPTWYADYDGDSFGNPDTSMSVCEAPTDFVADGSDCDDTEAGVNPDATEICNEVDDDCDGDTDEGVIPTWYADDDGDGFGDPAMRNSDCVAPAGYVSDATDCNDSFAESFPGGTEVCDGLDNNCDGTVDEGVENTYYTDTDGDGFGDPTRTQEACDLPTGYVEDGTDCNDGEADSYPGAEETCDSHDNDCDGTTDEDPVDGATWYQDADADGSGNPDVSMSACTEPAGFVANVLDCDDTNAYINPSITEACNEVDDDCDGTTDEDDATGTTTWYADADGDGYGNPDATQVACDTPTNYVSDSTDCNDSDSAVSPAASEQCNDKDDDCDGTVDNNAVDVTTWYEDLDSDGFGGVDTIEACDMPSGHSVDGGDCNDYDSAAYPGAEEVCDSQDQDCDGTVDNNAVDALVWYLDYDADLYGDVTLYDWSCDQPTGYVATAGDYDDWDPSLHYSPCQDSLVVWGLETLLYAAVYNDLEVTLTESTPTDYILLVWEDASAPTGYWISCGEVASFQASMLAPDLSGYNANAWYDGYEGYSYPEFLTALSREDGVPFSLVGASYSSTVYFEETP